MPTIAILADIHGCLPALEKALEQLADRHQCSVSWRGGRLDGSAECAQGLLQNRGHRRMVAVHFQQPVIAQCVE